VAPVLAIALAVVIFVAQMQAIGTTSYYFLKFFMGTELILVVVVPAVTAMLAASVTRPRPRRVGIAVSVLGCLLASQAFGLMPGHKWMLLSETDDGTAALSGRYSRVGVAEGIVAAAQHTSPAASIRLEYLALGPGAAASAFYADGWYHGVNASLTTAGMGRLSTLTTRVDDVQEAAPVVTKVLASAPDVRILVAPAYLTPLRSQLPPELARRVVSWAP
jgi:hypothetical protein